MGNGPAWSIALGLFLAGCVAPHPENPDAGPQDGASSPLEITAPVRIDARQPAREPAIAVTSKGTIFVSGYQNSGSRYGADRPPSATDLPYGPYLWASHDKGATWKRINLGTTLVGGASGDSDVDLANAADGTLYFATLTFTPPFTNGVVAVGASTDDGASWRWTRIAAGPFEDRPWVRVAPDGSAHVVWNNGRGVYHASTNDRGATWSAPNTVAAQGGDGGYSIGPDGLQAVRLVPVSASGALFAPGVDGVGVSTDGGRTWKYQPLPGERKWATTFGDGPVDGTPRAWDPVAIGSDSTIYAAWGESKDLILARSSDRGATWERTVLTTEPTGNPHYPFLRAAATPGLLAASWFVPNGSAVDARFALVEWSSSTTAVRLTTLASGLAQTYGEYFETAFEADGVVVTAVPGSNGMDRHPFLDFRRISFTVAAP